MQNNKKSLEIMFTLLKYNFLTFNPNLQSVANEVVQNSKACFI
jgi:hypothetical protein